MSIANSGITNAVVPVAGLGTRMLPATKSQPKEMLPVGKRPVVQYVIEELDRNNFQRVLFITGANKYSIENHFDPDPVLTRHLRETGKEELLEELEFERSQLHFFYTRQKTQRGLGDAILHAEEFSGTQPFAVALGDSILGRNSQSRALSHMAELFTTQKCAAVVAFEEVPLEDVSQYGIAAADKMPAPGEQFVVRDIVEKPTRDEAPSQLAVAARYIFGPQIFPALHHTAPGKGGEIQLTDAIRALVHNGEKVLGVRLPQSDTRYDIGNFEDYFKTFVEFALFDEKYGPALRQHVRQLLEQENA
ncbi:MAG: UTP--glucose-phosphate uridylyltransferase [Abditibacteriota bacterium]|jgi:UTP--glucose-1-phosphate uridylyltransferase|nr:UTP--glucose-phosphate uridylyltransferase [Abditibacteriota bacterium]